MHQSGEEEQPTFSDGIAGTYEDGLLRKAKAEAAADEQSALRTVPPPGLSGDALRRFRELVQQERRISDRRRRLHDRIAFVKTQGDHQNEQTDAQLEYLMQQEGELSSKRKELHRLIDEFQS